MLPRYNFAVLSYLMEFCADLVANQEVNKMGPNNVAIVLGPILLVENSTTLDMTKHNIIFGVIQTMITEHSRVFVVRALHR